ncbi:hypothetical protein LMG3412_06279 [Achromobacter deleyi]|nr:hypothetical protein LMG3412_06279 [Achromobacter deleyi]
MPAISSATSSWFRRRAFRSSVPRARPSLAPGPAPTGTAVPARRSIAAPAPSTRRPSVEVSSISARFGLSMMAPRLSVRKRSPCVSSRPLTMRSPRADRRMLPTCAPLASMAPLTVRLPLSTAIVTCRARMPLATARSPRLIWKAREPVTPPESRRWFRPAKSAMDWARSAMPPPSNGTQVPPASYSPLAWPRITPRRSISPAVASSAVAVSLPAWLSRADRSMTEPAVCTMLCWRLSSSMSPPQP